MTLVCGYARMLQTCPWTIGTEFTDDKDASRRNRTRFMDRFLLSHDTWEVTEKRFLMDESKNKGHFAWLLIIQFCHLDEDTYIFGTLQNILYMFEDIFCWHI